VSQWDKLPGVRKLVASEIHSKITNNALIQWAARRGLQLDRAAKRSSTVLWCRLAQNSHKLWPTPQSVQNSEIELVPRLETPLTREGPIEYSLDEGQWTLPDEYDLEPFI
jgi:hypothetical protein